MSTTPTYLKFAVMGISGAGATTLIRTVEESAGATGRLDVRIKLGLLPKAQDQWGIVLADKAGIVVMVDSTNPAAFPDIRELIETAQHYSSAPIIMLANKQDNNTALKPEQIRSRMHLPADIPIIPCVAKDRISIRQVMRLLTDWTLQQR